MQDLNTRNLITKNILLPSKGVFLHKYEDNIHMHIYAYLEVQIHIRIYKIFGMFRLKKFQVEMIFVI